MQFPMQFEVKGDATAGIKTLWEVSTGGLSPISCSIPAEFRGPGGAYSPEDLLGLAAISCLMATFKVYCEMSSVTFTSIMAKADIIVDRPKGKPMGITEMRFSIFVTGASNPDKARQLLEESKKSCLVTNALNVEKAYHFEVS